MSEKIDAALESRAEEIYSQHFQSLAAKVDQIFAWLLLVEWPVSILFALLISPRAWSGSASQVHPHVYAAFALGGAITLLPVALIILQPGAALNRFVVAVSQILYSVLFIHLTGGRIETHFHIFGSLAFLAFYRDWRTIAVATAVTTADHLVRGFFWPESVYGVLSATPWRAFEHAGWVIFEDVVLFYAINLGLRELWEIARSRAELEFTMATIEDRVEARTRELRDSNRIVLEQQDVLISSAKMYSLGEMAGTVAHEINTPLAVIRTYALQLEDLLAAQSLAEKDLVLERTAKIVKTVDRVAKIVRGLRTFSRDGHQDSFAEVKLAELVDETVSFCRERFKNRGVRIDVDVEDVTFEGRATQISQVLLNLLNNAHDAVCELEDRWVRLSARPVGAEVELRVDDSGLISESVRRKLFQPFFTTKDVGQGTGLGLSVSLGIVKTHGGTLLVETDAGHTSFVIRLPRRQSVGDAGRGIA